MPEIFFGPWSVRVKRVNASFAHRLVITGADVGDGVHPAVVGAEISVVGRDWQISLEVIDGAGWHRSGIRRTATFTAVDGLVVTLGGDGYGGDDYDDLVVAVQSHDPGLGPLRPAATPYDFTIPERMFVHR
jgi:hypothetical protein